MILVDAGATFRPAIDFEVRGADFRPSPTSDIQFSRNAKHRWGAGHEYTIPLHRAPLDFGVPHVDPAGPASYM